MGSPDAPPYGAAAAPDPLLLVSSLIEGDRMFALRAPEPWQSVPPDCKAQWGLQLWLVAGAGM